MALNTAHHEGGVVIHQGEMILLHAPNAQITFSGSNELKFGEKGGNAYLTTHRMIFLAGKSSGPFKSFSFPFCVLSEVDVEQPMFGANFLKGKVRAQPDGNWKGEAKFKLIFKSGGAIDFAQGMVKAMQIAKQMSSQSQFWNQPPPSYNQATDGNFQQAPPSYYETPGNVYGWMPPAYNFPPPQAGSVYLSDLPPAYPGMTPAAGPANGFNHQSQTNGYYPSPTAYAAPQAPVGFGYPPPGPGVPQTGPGYGAYPPLPGSGGPPAGSPGFGFPQAPNGTGHYPPPQNGYAFANGNQAFVPASAPPAYDEASKKTN